MLSPHAVASKDNTYQALPASLLREGCNAIKVFRNADAAFPRGTNEYEIIAAPPIELVGVR